MEFITTSEGDVMQNEYEAAVDTKLAQLHTELDEIARKLNEAHRSLAYASGAPMEWHRKQRVCRMTLDELTTFAQNVLDDESLTGRFYIGGQWTDKASISDAITRVGELRTQVAEKRAEIKTQDELYTGWSRFFLVTSSAGGHIHSSTQCSTCRFDTGFAWLPTLSGLTEKNAVDAHGAILCTVCFPSAPVEWTNAHELEAEKRAAEKCSGSGQMANNPQRRRYCHCETCGEYVSVTSTGRLRAHKPAAS